MLAAQKAGGFVEPPSERLSMELTAAYSVGAEAVKLRLRAGWRLAGWKVGFTNRRMWERLGLDGPIVAPVYRETLFFADDESATPSAPPSLRMPLGVRAAPRLEVEVVFGLAGPAARTPRWAALGVELVDCHYEGWRLHPADAVADFGLHAGLAVGPPTVLGKGGGRTAESLREARVSISRAGRPLAEGHGRAVLDGPADVLTELSRSLRSSTAAYLAATEARLAATPTDTCVAETEEAPAGSWVVSTGTLTPLVEARPGARYHVECDLLPPFSLDLVP